MNAVIVGESKGDLAGKPFANSQFMVSDGVVLHYRIWLAKQVPARGKVLLVHGLGGSTYSWEAAWQSLCQAGYSVLAVDLPGFGYSSRQRRLDHSQKNRARLVWLLLHKIDKQALAGSPGAKWHLVGHSMGAGAVAAMALAEPQKTAGLVFVDGALFDLVPKSFARLFRFPPACWVLSAYIKLFLLNKAFIRKSLHTALGQEPAPGQVLAYYRALAARRTAICLVDMVRTMSSEPAAAIKDLPVKVFAIWGRKDTWLPLAKALELQAFLPSLDLQVIDGAFHAPMESHAGTFNSLLLEMISD